MTVATVLAAPLCRSSHADEPIALLIHDRPPLYVIDGNQISGLVAGPAANAFEMAGIAVTWQVTPSNRQLRLVESNEENVCAVGWFKTPRREAFALFTDPIYIEQSQVAIIRSDDARLWGHATLATLFRDDRLTIGKKLGYSYGSDVDGKISKFKTPSVTTPQNIAGMVRMLLGNRFDYFFSNAEEADLVLQSPEFSTKNVSKKLLKDMAPGNSRHIICSASVGADIIDRLNAAIASTQQAKNDL